MDGASTCSDIHLTHMKRLHGQKSRHAPHAAIASPAMRVPLPEANTPAPLVSLCTASLVFARFFSCASSKSIRLCFSLMLESPNLDWPLPSHRSLGRQRSRRSWVPISQWDESEATSGGQKYDRVVS